MITKLLTVALFLLCLHAATARAEEVVCPTVLKNYVATEDAALSKSWMLGGLRKKYILKAARIFVGPLSEESLQPKNEVKPIPHMETIEGIKVFYQVWNLEDPRYDQALLVCDYAGSENYLIHALDPNIKKCSEIDPVDNVGPTRVACQ